MVPPRAIAVTGATGCGKSLLCHHLSTILGVPSLHPTLSDIVRGEVGTRVVKSVGCVVLGCALGRACTIPSMTLT